MQSTVEAQSKQPKDSTMSSWATGGRGSCLSRHAGPGQPAHKLHNRQAISQSFTKHFCNAACPSLSLSDSIAVSLCVCAYHNVLHCAGVIYCPFCRPFAFPTQTCVLLLVLLVASGPSGKSSLWFYCYPFWSPFQRIWSTLSWTLVRSSFYNILSPIPSTPCTFSPFAAFVFFLFLTYN